MRNNVKQIVLAKFCMYLVGDHVSRSNFVPTASQLTIIAAIGSLYVKMYIYNPMKNNGMKRQTSKRTSNSLSK